MEPLTGIAPPLNRQFERGPLRVWIAGAIVLAGAVLFHAPLYALWLLSFTSSLHSHTLMIPAVSLYILWLRRKWVFADLTFSPRIGGAILSAGLLIAAFQGIQADALQQADRLFLAVLGLLLWLTGGFVLVCGRPAFKKALFPILFLGFMLPLPPALENPVLHFLQSGSALAARMVLELLGVPVHSEGMLISVPGLTVEVAAQCSGIRSALALLILSTVAGYLFLNAYWRRVVLVLAVIPVTILKNGLRIVTLALLGAYVDIAYLTDSVLHSSGGKPFLVLAVLMLAPVLWLLRRTERKKEANPVAVIQVRRFKGSL